MSRTYREFGDLLSAYNEADEKWTPIQKAHEFLDSVNEDEIWEQWHAAADALFTYIAELEGKIDQLTAHSDIERQDDNSSNDTQKETFVYGKESEE